MATPSKRYVILLLVIGCQLAAATYLEALVSFFSEGGDAWNRLPRNADSMLEAYDFIIVGAGTAGCVIANRLSEVAKWKVLLIEAGRNENFIMDIPIIAPVLQFSDANWKYYTEPKPSYCLGMKRQRCHWPRGKVLGGSSVLNYMIFTRGNRIDYDQWEAMGNTGWGYEDVLTYFKKSEDMAIPELQDSPYHSKGGYLTLSYAPYETPLSKAFLKAGVELGYNVTDYNGERQTGFSRIHTTTKGGTRWSSSRAFLAPAASRTNLHVLKETLVSKIIIDPTTKRAKGVEVIRNGRKTVINARKEVILSAGALNTPQLLMLSGVGPRNHLQALKIPVVQDLKVGYNLMDHIALGGLTFLVNTSLGLQQDQLFYNLSYHQEYFMHHDGPLSIPGLVESLAFINTKFANASIDYPDMELLFIAAGLNQVPFMKDSLNVDDSIMKSVYEPMQDVDSFMVFPMLMRPKSKGRVKLRDRNPRHKPLFYPNYLADQLDIDTIVEGTKYMIELSKTKAFQKYGTRLLETPIPGCKFFEFGSDDYWRCATRHLTVTIYHQSGTCKMGPASDPDAVVDPQLKVYGVGNLRVIDASIIPQIPTAHTNGPVYMIAEKGSDLVKETWL